jgi:hypothetical protein
MLNNEEINCLGNILNNTWGKSNNNNGRTLTSKLKDDVVSLTFHTVVNFASEQALREQTTVLNDESNQFLGSMVSDIKSKFKEKTGNALKLNELSDSDNIEMIQASINSPRKIALYRRTVTLEIQN